jgi:hypothetical protein
VQPEGIGLVGVALVIAMVILLALIMATALVRTAMNQPCIILHFFFLYAG